MLVSVTFVRVQSRIKAADCTLTIPTRAETAPITPQTDSPPIRIIEMSNIELRISCAAGGMGITVLPLSTVERLADRETVRFHDIPEPWCWLDTYLISRADSLSFAARRQFRSIVLSQMRSLKAVS